MKFIILPGNPPSRFHYNLWINELKELLPESSFHYLDYLSPAQDLTPHKVLELMHLSLTKKILELESEERTIVLAHSFGGYFTESLIEHAHIECILIFPFLGAPTLPGRRKLDSAFFFKRIYSIKFIQALFHRLLKVFMPEAREISKEELVKGVLTAAVEREVLRDKIVWSRLAPVERATLIYNLEDKWSPPETTNYLKKMMASIETEITHDFVLYKSQRELMSALVVDYCQKGGPHLTQGQVPKE